ncbi:OB-fold nucleic acid binding domain-containing protein [Streptomyces sp. NPDC001139]
MIEPPPTSAQPAQVFLVADARAASELYGDRVDVTAVLRGEITFVQPRGGMVFMRLRDGTGSIQIIASRDSQGASWPALRQVKRGSRLAVWGPVKPSNTGTLSVMLDTFEILAAPGTTPPLPGSRAGGPIHRQLYLPRLRSAASAFFHANGFLEIETSLLERCVPPCQVPALQVVATGQGQPLTLTVSPHPQLAAVAAKLGHDRIFTWGHSFTGESLNRHASTEAPVLGALVQGLTYSEVGTLLTEAVSYTLRGSASRFAGGATVRPYPPEAPPGKATSKGQIATERLPAVRCRTTVLPFFGSNASAHSTVIKVALASAGDILLAEAVTRDTDQPCPTGTAFALSLYIERFLRPDSASEQL